MFLKCMVSKFDCVLGNYVVVTHIILVKSRHRRDKIVKTIFVIYFAFLSNFFVLILNRY
jgi:hypothetical protein